MSRDMWDPEQYGRYGDERARAFFELIARIRADRPGFVVDLGCGPGDLTAYLARRWPQARIDGIDSSAAMIARARRHEIPSRLEFAVADLRAWRPARPPDVIVANAVLHWVPGHHEELPARLVAALAPGGWLAFQVPGNFAAPSHTILRELCGHPRWRDRLGGTLRHDTVVEPAAYLTRLAELGCVPDVWETTYLHVLPGDDPVLEWVKGSALRPVLDALDRAGREDFLAEYGARLRAAYPRRPYGTVLPFRRIFAVARKAR